MQLRFYPQFSWCAREDVNGLLTRYNDEDMGDDKDTGDDEDTGNNKLR